MQKMPHQLYAGIAKSLDSIVKNVFVHQFFIVILVAANFDDRFFYLLVRQICILVKWVTASIEYAKERSKS